MVVLLVSVDLIVDDEVEFKVKIDSVVDESVGVVLANDVVEVEVKIDVIMVVLVDVCIGVVIVVEI